MSVWECEQATIDRNGAAPTVETVLADGGAYGRTEVRADVQASTFAQTTFLWRKVGEKAWQNLGTDDNAPFRVFHDVSAIPVATPIEYRAVVKDAAGRVAGDSTATQVVAPPKRTVPEIGDPVTQPSAVSVPGTHNSEMGCPVALGVSGDWAPDCDQAQLALDTNDQIWKKTFTLPAGPYAYKAAINRSWTESYGRGGGTDNIDYETDGTRAPSGGQPGSRR